MASIINLTAASRDFVIDQGSTLEVPFLLTKNGAVFDLTNMIDVRLQVRRTYNSPWIINATLANGKMEWINRAGGSFRFLLQPSDTTDIVFKKDEDDSISGVYDLELETIDGYVYKGCKGSFTINREVTHA